MSIPGIDPNRRRSSRGIKYNTDPATAASSRMPVLPGSIFDQDRLLAAAQQGLIDGLPELPYPNDELLIATLVDNGQPRWSAEQLRYHPGLRKNCALFWLDVQLAAGGDKQAQDRVDAVREKWQEMRRAEQISDHPERATGYVAGDRTNQSPV